MKRSLILFMVLGLAVGSIAAAEAKKMPKRVERTLEATYGPYPAPVTGCSEVMGTFACLIVQARGTESFFTAKVADTHGQPVFVQVTSNGGTIATFCGETTEPIAISGGTTLEFHVALENWPADIAPDCPANRIKSTGTISVTLSNLPQSRGEAVDPPPTVQLGVSEAVVQAAAS